VKGLWCFTGKKVIGLTAALSEGHINIARLAIMSKGEEPTLLEFPSSYSFYTNQPQDAGTIIPCDSDETVM
jgi:hypothetical protein